MCGNSTPELPSGNKLDVGRTAGQWAENGRRRRRCLEALAVRCRDRARRQPHNRPASAQYYQLHIAIQSDEIPDVWHRPTFSTRRDSLTTLVADRWVHNLSRTRYEDQITETYDSQVHPSTSSSPSFHIPSISPLPFSLSLPRGPPLFQLRCFREHCMLPQRVREEIGRQIHCGAFDVKNHRHEKNTFCGITRRRSRNVRAQTRLFCM